MAVQMIGLDTRALQRKIEWDGRPVYQISEESGLARWTLYKVVRHGQCSLATLDKLCGALSIHQSEIEA